MNGSVSWWIGDCLLLAVMLLPIAIVIWKKLKKQPRKYSSADALQVAQLLSSRAHGTSAAGMPSCASPRGSAKRLSFEASCVSICMSFPWKLNLTAGAAGFRGDLWIAAPLPGAWPELLSTVVIGGLCWSAVPATGNLLLPMVLHAVMDLRMLLLLPPAGLQSRHRHLTSCVPECHFYLLFISS